MSNERDDLLMSYLDEDYMSTTSQFSWNQFQDIDAHYFPLVNLFQAIDVSQLTQAVKPNRGRKKRDDSPCVKPLVPILPAGKITPEKEDQMKKEASKRQERLIKNRAAALLSRKRKRDHMNFLEEEKSSLSNENLALKESINLLEKENLVLKGILKSDNKKNYDNGMILMIILYFFALFIPLISTTQTSNIVFKKKAKKFVN
ncbi:hypothetical protein CU098_005294 [Rhizopus stolonifer]|uniref:BZIP domain-containing protein n=1 Tax=Rhizopus stolonifer TaxID=4846 RepID=A0A367J5M2_RHIST|nr:hypothetical protein CU098_005294 [Rhizopus stolonifer]